LKKRDSGRRNEKEEAENWKNKGTVLETKGACKKHPPTLGWGGRKKGLGSVQTMI